MKKSKYVQNGELVNGITVGRRIEDRSLKINAIFGIESIVTKETVGADGQPVETDEISMEDGSPENVDLVAQGVFTLTPTDDPEVFILGADHMLERKTFQGDFGVGYDPILAARYTSDGRSNFQIKYARIGIYPELGRLIRDWI